MATEDSERTDLVEEEREEGLARRAVLRTLGGAGVAAVVGALLALDPEPAAAQATAAPAATVIGSTSAALEVLAALPGIIAALEWETSGKLVAYRSKLPVPRKEAEQAAQIGAVVSAALPLGLSLYSQLSALKWSPPNWIALSGGKWVVIIGISRRAVLAEAAVAGLPEIFAALGGASGSTGTPTP